MITKPYKQREFKLYILWSAIPSALKRLSESQLQEVGFDTADSLFRRLLNVKTKTEFAKQFKVSVKQLIGWEHTDEFKKEYNKFVDDDTLIKFKKDIVFHFSRKTIVESDAPRVKLWMQLFAGWTEKSEIKHDINLMDNMLDEINGRKESPVKNIN